MQALYATMQYNGKLYNVHDVLSYFVILILIFFHIDWLSLFERCDNLCNLILSFWKHLRGLPQSVCFVWFCHLTILEWWQWSHLTFNQSIEILTLGFSLFSKNLDYSAQQEKYKVLGPIACTIEGWQWIVTLWYMTKWSFLDLRS